MKVVQILYAYLLTEKQFSLESMPGTPTKEKRFAYSLYLDMLVFMMKVADEITLRGGVKPLAETRFIKRLKNDDVIKSQLNKYRTEPFPLDSQTERIAEMLKESPIYKNYMKRRDKNEFNSDETIWRDIFKMVIIPDAAINGLIAKRDNFTMKGVDRMREIMERTFVNFMTSHDSGEGVFRMLETSLDKARELYFRLLYLPVELTRLQEQLLDERRRRFVASFDDLNPNLKFIDNELVRHLGDNDEIIGYMEKNNLSWTVEDRVMMDNLLKAIVDSDIYAEYMSTNVTDLHSDVELWKNLFRKVILNNEYFLESLEDKSVFWNDDLDIISTFVIKTFRRIEEELEKGNSAKNVVLAKFKDEEDARFGTELMKYVLRDKDTYRGYIDRILDRALWESERLAFMDVIIIETALAEILNFPKIPLNVSLNEYIEIAKSYSTAKSGGFVNGVLASVIKNLQEEGKLLKK